MKIMTHSSGREKSERGLGEAQTGYKGRDRLYYWIRAIVEKKMQSLTE